MTANPARADDRRFDRYSQFDNQRWHDFNRRDYYQRHAWQDRHDYYHNGYNNGYGPRYYTPAPQTTIVVNRATPYDRPLDYRTYSNTRTVIYGDGNLVPIPNGTAYYYRR